MIAIRIIDDRARCTDSTGGEGRTVVGERPSATTSTGRVACSNDGRRRLLITAASATASRRHHDGTSDGDSGRATLTSCTRGTGAPRVCRWATRADRHLQHRARVEHCTERARDRHLPVEHASSATAPTVGGPAGTAATHDEEMSSRHTFGNGPRAVRGHVPGRREGHDGVAELAREPAVGVGESLYLLTLLNVPELVPGDVAVHGQRPAHAAVDWRRGGDAGRHRRHLDQHHHDDEYEASG